MEFFGKRGEGVLYDGLNAKFTQHKDLKHVLLETKDATLQQYIPKSPVKISKTLMKLRNNLSR